MGERGRVEPEAVAVLRHQRDRHVGATASSASFVGSPRGSHSRSRQPVPRIQRPPEPRHRGGHSRDRLLEVARALEPHLALGDRPLHEVDVRVGESGQDAAAAEIDPLRARQRVLVHADAARDQPARDRERARRRQRRLHRPHDPVLEDHAGTCRSPGSPPPAARGDDRRRGPSPVRAAPRPASVSTSKRRVRVSIGCRGRLRVCQPWRLVSRHRRPVARLPCRRTSSACCRSAAVMFA